MEEHVRGLFYHSQVSSILLLILHIGHLFHSSWPKAEKNQFKQVYAGLGYL